ncbi:MAG: serine/threonine-protein kinase [Gemmatimonadota bacterium]|jgi:serine/threonine-protein kinase
MPVTATATAVNDLFVEALAVPPEERSAFLDARCAGAPSLRAEVASLLAHHDATGLVPRLEEPDAAEAAPRRYPDRIGSYRIVRPLGEGGMGVVLLAVREGPGFEQTVALKLIRSSVGDPLLVRRLEEERRILARLEHPGIARLVDGGVTPDGQPYYAMEYVRGEDILAYCDARCLDVHERLELFARVCDAVHHAHQQLVVHRDLKPSNILVTPEGRPKLLDFGIAKNLETMSAGEHTARWATPAYASPEQVLGGPVSTLSDVYALGVLLCELLTGARPYETAGRTPVELGWIVGQQAPARPSELATERRPTPAGAVGVAPLPWSDPRQAARDRRTTPQRLARTLRGDLDLVVTTALAKEPARRYESAWALGQDVRRWLAGQPIAARPASLAYRAGRLIRRHRGLAAVAALFVLALGAGTGGILWQARQARAQAERAELQAARAQRVTALMTDIFRLGDPARALGDTVGVRQVLDEGVRRVSATMAGDPVLQGTLYLELGRVYRNLGLLGEASRLGARATRLRAAHEPGTPAYADALGFQGLVLRDMGRSEEAVDHLRRAVDLRTELDVPPDTTLASFLVGLGWELRDQGEYDAARDLFTRALDVQTPVLGATDPEVARTMMGLAASFHDADHFSQAEALLRAELDRNGDGRPRPDVASALVSLGMMYRLRGRSPEAEPLLRRGYEARLKLFGADHPATVEAEQQLGVALLSLDRLTEAEEVLEDALPRAIRVLGEAHQRTRSTREALALVDHHQGRYALALARLDSVARAKRRAHHGDHPGVVYTLNLMGDVLVDAGRCPEAEERYREALAMGARLGNEEGVYAALSRLGLARAALSRNDLPAADSLSSSAEALLQARLRPDHRYVREAHGVRAQVLRARGQRATQQ